MWTWRITRRADHETGGCRRRGRGAGRWRRRSTASWQTSARMCSRGLMPARFGWRGRRRMPVEESCGWGWGWEVERSGRHPSHEWVDRVTAHVLCRARERASGKIKTIAAAKSLGNNNTSDSDGSRFHSPVQLSQILHLLAHSQSHPHLRSFDPAPVRAGRRTGIGCMLVDVPLPSSNLSLYDVRP
ncbi:hypothetical protein B0H14DRAFT_1212490 [Mycena olivaceomarginata]|nr:hypothetical protein B0H14DRAFT_1212490 [Mycena olivaceomarginata]